MSKRTEKEMLALLVRFDELLGPIDKWSEPALAALVAWSQRLEKEVAAIDPGLACNRED